MQAILAKGTSLEKAKNSVYSRLSFNGFLKAVDPEWNWDWPHLRAVQAKLNDVTNGHINRLIISMPPRHGKTELTTIRYPIYRLLSKPDMRVILTAYNFDLAKEFAMKARRLAIKLGLKMRADKNMKSNFETLDGGSVVAIGAGGGFTGRGADLVVIDDPIKSYEEAISLSTRQKIYNWFHSDVQTRLEPNGAIVVIMTRWHEDDLVGRLIKEDKGVGKWSVLSLPAICEEENDPCGRPVGAALCPERFDEEYFDTIRNSPGTSEYTWQALYQQRPSPPSARVFEDPFFYDELPEGGYRVVGGLDLAYSSKTHADYTVAVVGYRYGNVTYIVDVERWQEPILAVTEKLLALQNRYPGLKLCAEDNGQQLAVLDQLQSKGLRFHRIRRNSNKFAEAQVFAAAWNSGRVVLPRDAPWLKPVLDEITSFTGRNDRHDDIVDAFVNMSKFVAARAQIIV